MSGRLFRKAVQQGRSKRRGEAYSCLYVEPLRAARTPLAAFVNSLLAIFNRGSKGGRTGLVVPGCLFERR